MPNYDISQYILSHNILYKKNHEHMKYIIIVYTLLNIKGYFYSIYIYIVYNIILYYIILNFFTLTDILSPLHMNAYECICAYIYIYICILYIYLCIYICACVCVCV